MIRRNRFHCYHNIFIYTTFNIKNRNFSDNFFICQWF